MHSLSILATILAVVPALAFPGLRPGGLRDGGRRTLGPLERRAAEPYSLLYPYTGAKINGLPGLQIGGVLVPATGDTAHQFQPPPPGAYRGPCPGLNAAANHGFLSRDGITTFDELVAAQQNVYNAGYDLSVVLAALGVAYDGDIVTEKLSIGGDATELTSVDGGLTGQEGGLATHNTFETDSSLTRNDYYLANGDDHSFNGALFKMMTSTVSTTSSTANPLYNFAGLALYRSQRFDQSKAENDHFYFGAKGLLLYGAASFLYELFPSQNRGLVPDQATISSFFGAVKNSAGGYDFQPERIPDNWTNRLLPYALVDTTLNILSMYLAYPKLFGGNAGKGNFVPDVFQPLSANATVTDITCLFYNIITDNVPGSVSLPVDKLAYIVRKINPVFGNLGCPLVAIP